MGGDLNLKKSWHPHLMKNQIRVYEEEKKALAERKQTDKLLKERAEERALEDLQRLQEANGGTTRPARVEWMYNGPADGSASGRAGGDSEQYLLGNRRIDKKLLGAGPAAGSADPADALRRGAAAPVAASGAPSLANSAADTAAKVRNDPLLLIKKAQMDNKLRQLKDAQRQGRTDRDHRSERHGQSDRDDRSDRHHPYRSKDRVHKRRASPSDRERHRPSGADERHARPHHRDHHHRHRRSRS